MRPLRFSYGGGEWKKKMKKKKRLLERSERFGFKKENEKSENENGWM